MRSDNTDIAVAFPPAPSPTKIVLFPSTVSVIMAFKFLLTEDNSLFLDIKKGLTDKFNLPSFS